jgi:hypothetical protein
MQARNLVCSQALCAALVLAAAPPEVLKVVVLEGQGAINNIRERSARAPVVRVEDENGQPVAGVHIVFTLPDLGAGGSFSNGQSTLSSLTGKDGRAVAWGLRPNNVAGRFLIQVSASYQGVSARAAISQTNAAPTARSSPTKKIVIAGLAAGAIAGALFAAKGGGGSSPSSTGAAGGSGGTTVVPGSPVFGPPH